jgi:hypothetical protein
MSRRRCQGRHRHDDPRGEGRPADLCLGQPTDVPIAGDWDGDGTDTPGLVRNGSQWLLSKSIRKPGKSVTLDVALAADQVPLVGTQATGRGHCPTATPGSERAAARLARKVRPPARLTGNPQAPGQADVRALVQDSLRYVMTFDYTNRLKDERVTPRLRRGQPQHLPGGGPAPQRQRRHGLGDHAAQDLGLARA